MTEDLDRHMVIQLFSDIAVMNVNGHISVACLPCESINVITSLATAVKQNSLIIIQPNAVMLSTRGHIQGQLLFVQHGEGLT